MLDPVCIAMPVNAWTSNLFDVNTLGNEAVEGQIASVDMGNANSNAIIEFKSVAPSILQQRPNYYKHAVLRNLSIPNQFARIVEYTFLGNNRAQVVTDNLQFQYNLGDFVAIVDPTDFTSPTADFLFVPDGATNEQAYANKIIYNETLNQSRPIGSYDAKTGMLLIGGTTAVGWLPSHNYSIRTAAPNYVLIAGGASTTSQVIIPAIPGDFNNWFIRVPRNRYNNTVVNPQGEARRIVSYNATTNTALVSPPFSASPATMKIELMQQGYDNANPFNWRGNMSQEIPTYKVALKRLILPNKVMSVGNGGRPSFANYFYVELSNVDIPSQQLYSIYSNNPHSSRAVFRATVKDVVRLQELDFIALEGDMVQTLRIRLESNIKIRIVIPSTGETFQTTLQDNMSPDAPNPFLQVNALFEFQQIN